MSGWTILTAVVVAGAASLLYLTIAAFAIERAESDLRSWEKKEEREFRRRAELQEAEVESA